MRVAFVGGARWSAGSGRVENGSIVVEDRRIVGLDVDPGEASVIEVGDRFLTPGFIDAHVHPVTGGVRMLTCDLTETSTRTEAEGRIQQRAAALPPGEWLTGGGWLYQWYEGGNPSALDLDRLAPGRPAALNVRDGHSTWANSAALALAGITAATPDPFDGRIERSADGSPQGTLHEGAMGLIASVTPVPDRSMLEAALEMGTQYLHSKGVTGWQDAWVTDIERPTYLGRRGSGPLVTGALWWDRNRGMDQVDEILERRLERTAEFWPDTVKLMLDGVCENFTAALGSPYVGPHGLGEGHDGIDFISPDTVARAVTAFDGAGMQCHFHAIGDRAIRSALDAVESARRANGWSGPIHHVAHLQVVHPHDIPRFADLRVAANCQALWACNDEAVTERTVPYLGPERSRWQYPFGSLLRAGALVVMGSDWPVSTADVMEQVSVAVGRRAPRSEEDPPLLPEEALTLDQALSAFTLGSARINGISHSRGRIRLGNVADLVLLERDPFEVPDPAGIQVDLTMVAGRIVYEQED